MHQEVAASRQRHTFFETKWPLLDRLLSEQRITLVDYALTQKLLQPYPSAPEEAAFFVCFLILSARAGHLCVRVECDAFFPGLDGIWNDPSLPPLSIEEEERLVQILLKGVQHVPQEMVAQTQNLDCRHIPEQPLCRFGALYYLQRYWVFETLLLTSFLRHIQTPPTLQLDAAQIREKTNHLRLQGVLSDEQAAAICNGCQHSFSILAGGPGTGKTYTAAYLIQFFWEGIEKTARKKCRIALAAPTGKAAAQLQKSLSRILPSLEDPPIFQAKTLHTLLGISSFSSIDLKRPPRINADFLIIDESSMIDIKMMACLFSALKEGSRLVLIGDPHQLSSIEAGSPFLDLIESASNKIPIPSAHLTVCLRTESSAIVAFAACIHAQNIPGTMQILADPALSEISHQPLEKRDAFILEAASRFPSYFASLPEPTPILQLFDHFRILSPHRKSPFGTESLNSEIQQHLEQNSSRKKGWMALPIIICTNDYQQNLFNGEAGVLIRSLPLKSNADGEYALFPPREDGEAPRRIAAVFLPKYELAYCLSIHKSQGSEFASILLVLPEGSEYFGSEGLYTAITRAKKQIEIYGSEQILVKMMRRKARRLSGIKTRIS